MANTSPFFGLSSNNTPIVAAGIPCVSVHELPDRLRSIFSFPIFNAMQSRCFGSAYNSDDNLVISAPTASGKTTVLELAICRLLSKGNSNNDKVVYIGPTKALCDQRYEDWQARFRLIGFNCGLVTGDRDGDQQDMLRRSKIIITTPEKWDSITRKSRDHEKLMHLVKLLMVDEVHILNEERGATIEAVISRVKSAKKPIRLIALSATVPNAEDVAIWLGRNYAQYNMPARLEVFGEEFRPSKLLKFVYPIPNSVKATEFGLDSMCDTMLPDIIREHSFGKPVLIFCPTRKSVEGTAQKLAKYWKTTERLWRGLSSALPIRDTNARELSTIGIACHHAGLLAEERKIIETAFLSGMLNIICCTSTLAVGVNLPCYLAIIKNTTYYKKKNELTEYSDLDIMQMLGRAGRPQFGDHGRGVVLTRSSKVPKYENLFQGVEPLESHLHLNLKEHLNAEIVLGTIRSVREAKAWLASTFFAVRLQRNQARYKIEGVHENASIEEQVDHLCANNLEVLRSSGMVQPCQIRPTLFGDLMAKQYVRLETMMGFRNISHGAKVADILSILAKAEELHEVVFRTGETSLLNEISKSPLLKYPVNCVDKSERKRILLLQAELGSIPFPSSQDFLKFRMQYGRDIAVMFTHIHRLIRCLVDTRRLLGDGISVRNGLEVSRSLAAVAWDDSPMILKQLPKVGLATMTKLQQLGIKNIEDLKNTAVEKLDRCRSGIPLFGTKLLAEAAKFPMLRVYARILSQSQSGGFPVVQCEAEIGFLNAKLPETFGSRSVRIHLLIIRSDGFLIDLKQIATFNRNPAELTQRFSVKIESSDQYVLCYVSCDELAGTLQQATIDPRIPTSRFPTTRPKPEVNLFDTTDKEFEDADLMDEDLLGAEDQDHKPIGSMLPRLTAYAAGHLKSKAASGRVFRKPTTASHADDTPLHISFARRQKLKNGKYACNHTCKDKSRCKHGECCRDGLDKPPPLRKKETGSVKLVEQTQSIATTLTLKPQTSLPSNKSTNAVDTSNTSSTESKDVYQGSAINVAQLRQNVTSHRSRSIIRKAVRTIEDLSSESEANDADARKVQQKKRKQDPNDGGMFKKARVEDLEADLSQDLADFLPFKSMDGIDLDLMAMFADCCEFVE